MVQRLFSIEDQKMLRRIWTTLYSQYKAEIDIRKDGSSVESVPATTWIHDINQSIQKETGELWMRRELLLWFVRNHFMMLKEIMKEETK